MKIRSAVRALVVDDHAPFRRFVCSSLREIAFLQIVGEASEGFEAVQKARELQPDLILLDIGLPKLNGIEACHHISRIAPAAAILFVSQIIDLDVVEEALRHGAKGYVWKQDAGVDLVRAVETVLRGAQFVSTEVAKSRATSPSTLSSR